MAAGHPYIQMFSIHGLLRAQNLELGYDADTGGQITYVVELAHSLSRRNDIGRVDLFTRLVGDKRVSADYSEPVETVNDKLRIIRIQCGGRRYMRKELLWPHLDEYTDKTIKFIKRENAIADIVHGHYPDAGFVAMQLASFFGLPFVYTGHSLGRTKLRRLLGEGMTEAEIIKKFKIDRRIEAEEAILANTDLVITSTRHEIDEQYALYRNKAIPQYKVVPPGIDVEKFYPYYHDLLEENEKSENTRYAQASMLTELNRFFSHPDKPLILALCRPDKRKNISGLIQTYGEDLQLQTMANLAIFAGLRKDINIMEENERDVLTRMLLLMDKYDLYGKMAIPKKHDFEHEVPALYRIAAEKRGVFVNPALTEPFGLTLLEASASGVPIVATNDGGPNDIVQNCKNGILVDPTKPKVIATALKKIITNGKLWERYSKNGILKIREHYTWDSHARTYSGLVKKLITARKASGMDAAKPTDAIGRRLHQLNYFLVTDIDNTLIDNDNARLEELLEVLNRNRDRIGFAVATGRTIESCRAILAQYNIPPPDFIISSVGSEIYYGLNEIPEQGWSTHIAAHWQRDKIKNLLEDFDYLTYQEEDAQREYKISYYMQPGKDRIPKIHNRLLHHKCRYNLIYSHDEFLDILPFRASKGKAIRYLSYKWEIPLKNFLVCGDSGNDEEMLRGEPCAVVVGNFSHELEALKGSRNVFFAQSPCAGGIIEGLHHYRFIETTREE